MKLRHLWATGMGLASIPLWMDACAVDLSAPNAQLGHQIKGCYTALDDVFRTATPIMRPFEYLVAFGLVYRSHGVGNSVQRPRRETLT